VKKATPKKQTKKRPAKKRPLARSKKSLASKKPRANIAARIPKTPASKKPKQPAKKVLVNSKRKRRQLLVPIGYGLHLEINFKIAPKKPKKKQRLSKKQLLKLERRQKATSVTLILAGLIGTIFFAGNLIKPQAPPPVYSAPEPVQQKAAEEVKPLSLPRSEPIELQIPIIGISTSLTQIGKNKNGTMEVPKSYQKAGWYKYSPTPGEQGPAIIAGHVDSFKGPAVFWRLSQLTPGQVIEIKRADGQMVKFKVSKVKQYNQDNFATDEVYGDIDHPGLRLITCGGRFSLAKGNYSHNTVVYATLAP
jgi:sortase (surface protein transpeptidase)